MKHSNQLGSSIIGTRNNMPSKSTGNINPGLKLPLFLFIVNIKTKQLQVLVETSQIIFSCSNSTIEALEKGAKYK